MRPLQLAAALLGFTVLPLWIFFSAAGLGMNDSGYTLFRGLLFFLVVSGIPVALHLNYLAADFNLLKALPMPTPVLFRYKLIETAATGGTLHACLTLPLVLGLCRASGAPPLIWIVTLAASVLFLFVAAALAVLLSVMVALLMPPNRGKNISATLSAVLFLALWAALNSADHSIGRFSSTAAAAGWLPSDWLAGIPQHYAAGAHTAWIRGLGFLVLAAALLFLIMPQLAGWSHGFIQRRRVKTGAKRHRPFISGSGFIFASIKRDFRLWWRDSRHRIQLLFFAGVILLLPLLSASTQIGAGVFATLMAGHIAARSFPVEGKAFSTTLAAPQPRGLIVLAKTIVACIFTLAAAIALPAATGAPFDAAAILLGVPGGAAIGAAYAAHAARYDWAHPRQMFGEGGHLMLSLCLVVFYLMLSTALLPAALAGAAAGTALAVRRLNRMDWLY